MHRVSKADRKNRTAKIRKFHSSAVAAILLLFLAGMLGGCFHAYSDIDHVRISPDGRNVVFIATDVIGAGIPQWGLGGGLHSMYVRWCSAECPDVQHSAKIAAGSLGMQYGLMGTGDLVEEVKFSPDSRHVAIHAPRRIWILQPATGKRWVLQTKDGSINSMTWISNDELAYCKVIGTGSKERTVLHLRVYRQKIAQPASDRTEVYRQDGKNVPLSFYWSPSGRYVVLGPCSLGQCRLLDIKTRKVLDFGPPSASLHWGVAWKTDESAVFCAVQRLNVMGILGIPMGNEYFLIEPVTGKITDCRKTCKFNNVPHFHPAPVWTADNQYIVNNAGWAGCSLIRLNPWKFIPLKGRLVTHLGITDNDNCPELHPFPVPGWLWTRHKNKAYAVDYQGRQFVPIGQGWDWAVSSDGKRIVEVDKNGKVTIRTLKLPPLPTTQPTTQPNSSETEK